MQKKKNFYYTQAILKVLMDYDVVTIDQIAKEVGLSEKAVRIKIDSIDDYLIENNLGSIEKKRRVGIWLNATDEAKIFIEQKIINGEDVSEHLKNNQTRMYTVLKRILKDSKNNRLTVNQLADSMYLSVPTTLKVVNECRDWLRLFDIELKVIRNKGFELKCNESQYRIAIKHFILHFNHQEEIDDTINYFMPNINTRAVRECIIQTENEWGCSFAEESFNEVLIYMCLSIYRQYLDRSNVVFLSNEELRILESYNETSFTVSMVNKVKNKFPNYELKSSEIAFISIPILCSKMIDPSYNMAVESIIREYDDRLKEFVKRIISVVSEVFNVDMTADQVLFNGLLAHMKPAIFRLRFERTDKNDLKGYIKNEYKKAFRVSWLISVLFEEYFNLIVTEDELSYITIYIQSALERNRQPIDAVLVTKTSMSVNQMLQEKLKRNFPLIRDIKTVSYHDFRIENYKNYQLICTTSPLGNDDMRIVEIDDLMLDNSVNKISKKIKEINANLTPKNTRFDPVCHSFFEPDLIFTQLDVNCKEECIKVMCERLVKKGYVTRNYVDTVLEREQVIATAIGNNVAIPHGEQNEIHEAKVVIATLAKPVVWGNEMVDVVFLLAVKMTNDFEISKTQLFYKQYINLVETDQQVNKLRDFKVNTDFYRYLIQ